MDGKEMKKWVNDNTNNEEFLKKMQEMENSVPGVRRELTLFLAEAINDLPCCTICGGAKASGAGTIGGIVTLDGDTAGTVYGLCKKCQADPDHYRKATKVVAAARGKQAATAHGGKDFPLDPFLPARLLSESATLH